MNNPFFSIIVPVYNVEKYLEDCIESILGQSYKDYELILVDDGATDNSGEICDQFAKNAANVRVIHKENGGLASARNAGLEVATGEWIWFVDSDDCIASEALTVLNKVISKHNAEVFCFNACKFYEGDTNKNKLLYWNENTSLTFRSSEEKLDFIVNEVLSYHVGWEACFRIYNRNIVEKYCIRFTNTKEVFAEDLDFTLRYYMHISTIFAACNILYYYRQVSNSIIHSYDETTIIRRLNNLSLNVYNEARKSGEKLWVKKFYRIYGVMMNHHIKYKLQNVSVEQIRRDLSDLPISRKWVRLVARHINEVGDGFSYDVWM